MGYALAPKKSVGFTSKKKKTDCYSLPKVELPPKVEETAMVAFVGEIDLTPPTTAKQPDAVVLLEDINKDEEHIT